MILVRLVGAAVALGLASDPEIFGSMLVSTWIAARERQERNRLGRAS